MKHYVVVVYDREMLKRTVSGEWKSEPSMLNAMLKRGYRVIEYREIKKED